MKCLRVHDCSEQGRSREGPWGGMGRDGRPQGVKSLQTVRKLRMQLALHVQYVARQKQSVASAGVQFALCRYCTSTCLAHRSYL